ncbi:MAG: hypothetical protein C4584_02320 [Armatimonadetes bacterium]|nr:MAG: hypothetical protein C4584_02320 [Armatimonadota bacterium]
MDELQEHYLKYKFLLWPVISGLASVVILITVIIPQVFAYFNSKEEIGKIENRLGVLEAKAQELGNLDGEKLDKDLKVAFSILPTTESVPQAMAALQEQVNKSGLILKNTSYASSRRSTSQSNFLLSIAVTGSMEEIRSFLINLQESPRVFQVQSISARFIKGEDLVEAEIPIIVLFQNSTVQTIKLDQPVQKLSTIEEDLLGKLEKRIPYSVSATNQELSTVSLGKANPFD